MKPIDLKLLDKRTVQRYLEQGLLKQEDYKKYLESLPDDGADSVMVNFEEIDQALDTPPIETKPTLLS